MPYYSKPYRDAVAIQQKIMQVLDQVATKDLANMAKGYATLETLKLRLRMKPAPKPVDVALAVKKSRISHVVTPSE